MTQSTGDPNQVPGSTDPNTYPVPDGTEFPDPNYYPPPGEFHVDGGYQPDPRVDEALSLLHNLNQKVEDLHHRLDADQGGEDPLFEGPDPIHEALNLLHDINAKLDSHVHQPEAGPPVYEGHVTLHPLGGHNDPPEYDTATGA